LFLSSLPLPRKTTAGSGFVHESEVCQTKQQKTNDNSINFVLLEERIYYCVYQVAPTICMETTHALRS
jgi:hypothetical protein